MTSQSQINLLVALSHLRPQAFAFPDNPLLPSPALAEVLGIWSLCDAVEALDGPALARWQAARLAALVEHATQRSPVWAKRLENWDGSLASVPPLARAAVAEQVSTEGALPVPVGHGTVCGSSTSGSTGVALRVYRSAWAGFLSELLFERHANQAAANLAAAVVVLLPQSAAGKQPTWGGSVGQLFATGTSESWGAKLSPSEFVSALCQHRGAVLATLPSVLRVMLEELDEASLLSLRGCVSLVFTRGAQVLESDRVLARDVLGSRIVDRYSAEEVGAIALQCIEHEEFYHVVTPNVIVETVRADGSLAEDGEEGRVLVTCLHSYATPFIRYEIGDLARLHSQCRCGFRGGALSDILGRAGEALVYPGGQRRLMALRVQDLLPIAPVKAYRLTRHAPLEFELEVQLAQGNLTDAQREAFRDLVLGMSVAEAVIRVVERDRIDWGEGYKRLSFVDLTSNQSVAAATPA
jgi:phenylacetate-CoA ligase